MKQLSMIAVLALMTACSSSTSPSPTAPEPAASSIETPTPAPAPGPTPTAVPGWTVNGPYPEPSYHCGAAALPNALSWIVSVHDAGDAPIHLIAMSHHSGKAGCESTIEEARGRFAVEGADSYQAHGSGEIGLTYNTHEYDCGRVQLDASFLDGKGGETLLVGQVVDYGVDCKAQPPTPPTPPPPPSPQPPPPPPPPPPTVTTTSCPVGVKGHITSLTVGGKATALVTAPAGVAVVASYVSYQASAATGDRLPQRLYHVQMQQVAAGSTAYFTVDVPACYYQVDLVCGPPIENLSETNRYGDRKLDNHYGGTKACW